MFAFTDDVQHRIRIYTVVAHPSHGTATRYKKKKNQWDALVMFAPPDNVAA